MINYYLLNSSKHNSTVNVEKINNKYIFDYPCESTFDCTDYVLDISPGVYKFELYGASGGSSDGHVSSYRFPDGNCIPDETVKKVNGNTKCIKSASIGGAGGYISGNIYIPNQIRAYATIGGRGIYGHKLMGVYDSHECYLDNNLIEGGYGGGGKSGNMGYQASPGSGSGGGQTAVKFLENDLWHRVIVSGAGGGCDNLGGNMLQADDGSGGAGGFIAQGWFESGQYVSKYHANSTYGFSFGSGESCQEKGSNNPNGVKIYSGGSDRPGSGSGWFGGFASHSGNSGSGGGSSWILSEDAIIPEGEIPAYDDKYNFLESHKYAFNKSTFLFHKTVSESGVWEGNGRLVITLLRFEPIPSICLCNNLSFITSLFVFILIYQS